MLTYANFMDVLVLLSLRTNAIALLKNAAIIVILTD